MCRVLPLLLVLLPATSFPLEMCIGPSTVPFYLGENWTGDCSFFQERENSWIGFNTSSVPCTGNFTPCDDSTNPPEFLWTISASDTDPFVNTGALEAFDSLFLWIACSNEWLPIAAVFDLTGDLAPNVLGFAPSKDVANIGSPTQLELALPCTEPPFLVGEIFVVTAPISVEPMSWGRVKATFR